MQFVYSQFRKVMVQMLQLLPWRQIKNNQVFKGMQKALKTWPSVYKSFH